MTSSEKRDRAPYTWPDSKKYKRSIRLQFAVVVSLLTVTLLAITGYGFSKLYVGTVTKSEIEKLLVVARSYSAPTGKLMIAGNSADDLLLQNVCKRLKTENPDVYWVGVADSDQRFKAHTDIANVIGGSSVRPLSTTGYTELLRSGEQILLLNDTIFVNVPIKENAAILGTLSLASSSAAIGAAYDASLFTVLSIFAIMLPLSIIVPTLTLRRQLKPVRIIADSLRSITYESAQIKIPYKSRNEFGFLAETLRSMGDRLETARQELAERERMARELEIAREIQMSILPRRFPQSTRYSVAGTYRSAKEVGGDYYDFIRLGDSRLGVVVADVSGKSLPGMLVMLLTRDLVKNHAIEATDPKALLCKVNQELYNNIREGMFVTMFYGILDEVVGKFTFASAGHNPLALLRRGGHQPGLIKTKGYPLAMMPTEQFDARIEARELLLKGGDILVQYTDGITEAQNEVCEEFGIDRLVQILQRSEGLDASQLVSNLVSGVDEFATDAEQYDDITIVAMQWATEAETSFPATAEVASDVH